MPFTSDLIGRYGSNPVAITLFGLNLVAISLSTQWIFLYAASHNLLMTRRGRRTTSGRRRVRALLVIAIVALSLVLAWTDTNLAKFVWLLFLVVPPVGERVSRRGRSAHGRFRRRQREPARSARSKR